MNTERLTQTWSHWVTLADRNKCPMWQSPLLPRVPRHMKAGSKFPSRELEKRFFLEYCSKMRNPENSNDVFKVTKPGATLIIPNLWLIPLNKCTLLNYDNFRKTIQVPLTMNTVKTELRWRETEEHRDKGVSFAVMSLECLQQRKNHSWVASHPGRASDRGTSLW